MIVQDLWQARYQILLINILKKLIRLNANMDMIIKNVKRAELKAKIASVVLSTPLFKIIFVEQKCLCCKRNYQKTFNENLKSGLLQLANFITMIPIYLFYCCKKVFTHLNT